MSFSLNIQTGSRTWPMSVHRRTCATMRHLRGFGIAAAIAQGLILTACQDVTRPGSGQTPRGPHAIAEKSFTCTVTMATRELSCVEPTPTVAKSLGIRADRIIGGQDIYLKLTSTGTTYDAGTEILSSDVTVQSLMQTLIGTNDGTTVNGVSVFFVTEPIVVSGTGTVTVANRDGVGVFNGTNQPYFLYSEILEPYQISAPRHWEFSVPATVNTFQFVLYVSTPMIDMSASLVDAVWAGLSSTDWSLGGNWKNGMTPVDTSVVAIPSASLLDPGANQPELFGDDTVSNLRVGEGSTLTLNNHRLVITRNLDAPGTISGGTVRLTGSSALLGGNLPALEIDGAARLQRPTATSGAVSITGVLSVQDKPFSVILP